MHPFLSGEKRVKTGLNDLDDALGGGLPDGGLTVLQAETGVGKTRLAAYFAAKSLAAGRDVVVFSTEGSPRDFPACVKAAYYDQPLAQFELEAAAPVVDFAGAQLRLAHRIRPDAQQVEDFLKSEIQEKTGLVIVDRLTDATTDGELLRLDDAAFGQWIARIKKILAERKVACVATAFPLDHDDSLNTAEQSARPQKTYSEVIEEMAQVIMTLSQNKDEIDSNLRILEVRQSGQIKALLRLETALERCRFGVQKIP